MAVAGKVAPVPKGEWAIGTSYNKIDIVTHNKDAYIALQNNIGQEPTRSGSAYWSLLMEHPGDNGCFVGTCSTGGSTAAKTVTISDTIILEAGVVVMVKYTYDNTATSPTLNINSTGAKSIHYNGAAITSSDLWTAGEADLYEIYVYDGTYWVWVGHSVNSGGVTEDTVAPVEQSPSTHAYTVGKQLYYNGILYTAIDDIAINDALTVGTNIQASDDLVTQIANAGKGVNTDKTMQEYQALTPEQQADPDIYYWIDDDPGINYDNIRDIVAPTEYSTAVGGHSTGDEFILGDYLYKAISAIAQGDDIVTSGTGQNAELAGTIVSQIKALFDGVDNPNLLDNPWFLINNGGKSSFTADNTAINCVDNWLVRNGTATVNSNGTISFLGNNTAGTSEVVQNIFQKMNTDFYMNNIAGKTVTLSVMLSDGTVLSCTDEAPSSSYKYFNLNSTYTIILNIANDSVWFAVDLIDRTQQMNITLKAAKLELGSVCTLTMDSPKYADEALLKMLPSFATDANPPYVSNGLRFYQFPAGWANAPSGVSVSGFLIDMRINSTTGFEFAGAWNSDSLYYRRFTSSTWGSWKPIYGVTPTRDNTPSAGSGTTGTGSVVVYKDPCSLWTQVSFEVTLSAVTTGTEVLKDLPEPFFNSYFSVGKEGGQAVICQLTSSNSKGVLKTYYPGSSITAGRVDGTFVYLRKTL